MLTAFLSRADVSRHMQALHLLKELREALTARLEPGSHQALRFDTPGDAASTLVRQATLPGLPAWAVSVRAEGHAQAHSVLQLHDAASGKLLAIMDARHLSALRASLVSALAADALARPDAKHVAVLGSGAAASSALKALRLVRSIEQVWLYEPNAADNFELAQRLQLSLSMAVRAVDSAQEAVQAADIVVLTGDVPLGVAVPPPGAHLTVLAAETFTAAPVPTPLLHRARRFCDASVPGLAWGAPFDAQLGEVLAGQRPGRQSPDDVTLFASVGPAFLDLLAAWHVFEGARHDEALTRIDLEA